MTDDLVKRLRDHAGDLRYHEWDEENEAAQKCAEAADRIEALTAENERLRAQLQAKEDGLNVRDRRIVALTAENARLRGALEWAADHEPWLVEKIYERAALGDTK